jgi:hypothetical protein
MCKLYKMAKNRRDDIDMIMYRLDSIEKMLDSVNRRLDADKGSAGKGDSLNMELLNMVLGLVRNQPAATTTVPATKTIAAEPDAACPSSIFMRRKAIV